MSTAAALAGTLRELARLSPTTAATVALAVLGSLRPLLAACSR